MMVFKKSSIFFSFVLYSMNMNAQEFLFFELNNFYFSDFCVSLLESQLLIAYLNADLRL